MINNAILPTGDTVSAPIPSHTALRNAFLAVKNGISLRDSSAARQTTCGSRANCVTASTRVLKVAGFVEMTAANCDLFRKTANAAWKGHTDIEIDLSETTFIDCAGLGALIAVRNLTHERHGVARLMNPTASVRRVLDFTRTGQLFEMVNAVDTDLAFSTSQHN